MGKEMDWTTVAVTACGLLLAGIGTVLWFLYLDVRKKADEGNRAAEKAAKDADQKSDAISRELSDYKLYVAEHYVTQGALTQAIEGLNQAIKSLTEGIRDMNRDFSNKLDSLHRRLDGKADKP
jgi:hypothetical protein